MGCPWNLKKLNKNPKEVCYEVFAESREDRVGEHKHMCPRGFHLLLSVSL